MFCPGKRKDLCVINKQLFVLLTCLFVVMIGLGGEQKPA
jgi:hypothetical protein